MSKGSVIENIVRFQVNRNIINLYKTFLIMLEDLEQEHSSNFNKLRDQLPDAGPLLEQADYFTEEKMDYLRKRILDAGNHSGREIMAILYNSNIISSPRDTENG